MSEYLEETSDAGSNLTAVQSISAKLLEVTRLAEKLDAKLCEAGARSQPLNPAGEDEELVSAAEDVRDAGVEKMRTTARSPNRLEVPLAVDRRREKSEESSSRERASERSVATDETTVGEEYGTATECSSFPRSCSESLHSDEYEDALVSTTCRKAEDESTMKNEVLPVTKSETAVSTNTSNEDVIEYTPDGATVIQRTIQEKGGKIVKETTETTTLRVSHNTHMGVASYKLVSNTITDHTDNLDYRELQDLNRTILNGCSSPAPPALKTQREEHSYTSGGSTINYLKSVATGALNGQLGQQPVKLEEIRESELELTPEEQEFLMMVKTVSEGRSTPIQQQQCQQQAASCTAAAVAEELAIMPAAIAVCEFN